MSAEELRRLRDAEYAGRRHRRAWEASLGGRSSLVAPLTRTRTLGGVQPPPVGVVAELGEITTFHMRGPLILDTSDPYPVVRGGAPVLQLAATLEPTGLEIDVWRNGSIVDTVTPSFASFGGAYYAEHVVEEVYVRGDLYVLDVTDAGTGGDGLVVATEFRASLS